MINLSEVNVSSDVENYVSDKGGSYIDAVLYVCEQKRIDLVVAAKHLEKPIIEKLEMEGIELNILPQKTPTLEFLG